MAGSDKAVAAEPLGDLSLRLHGLFFSKIVQHILLSGLNGSEI